MSMIFNITKSNNKQMLVKTESWLGLLLYLSNDVVKIERQDHIDTYVNEDDVKEG